MKDIFTAAEYAEMEALVEAEEAEGVATLLEDIELLDIEEDEALEQLGDWLEGMIAHLTEGC